VSTYLLGWDLDSDLLNSLSEFIGLNGSIIVQIKVLEGLEENFVLRLCASGLFSELVLKLSLETDRK